MKTKLFLLLLALSVLRTQAQSLSIKGRVTDTSQEAIIAANVSLWTIDSTLVTGVTSDAQGKFTLHKIKAGDYRLSISSSASEAAWLEDMQGRKNGITASSKMRKVD